MMAKAACTWQPLCEPQAIGMANYLLKFPRLDCVDYFLYGVKLFQLQWFKEVKGFYLEVGVG